MIGLQPQNIVAAAVVFELALGLGGALLARAHGEGLQELLRPSAESALRGVAGAAPMVALLVILMRSIWPPLVHFRRQVVSLTQQLFGNARWWELALLAAAAGVGEEILFRGALQPIAIAWTSPLAGLVIVSLIFGLLHAASSAYFLLATAVGVYLGWMTLAFHDLTAPIICHAIYDFVALLWLQRRVE